METDITARLREIADASRRALVAYTEITGLTAANLTDIEKLCSSVTAAVRDVEMLKPVTQDNDIREVDLGAAEKLVEEAEGGPLRARHAEVLKTISDLKALVADKTEGDERATILRLTSERDTAMARSGSLALRELYERASSVVSGEEWADPNQCPVCDSRLESELSDHLRERIAQYAAADEANASLAAAIEESVSISRLGSLESAAPLDVAVADRHYTAVVRQARDHSLPTATLVAAFSRLDELERNRFQELYRLDGERLEIEKTLPPSLVAVSRMLASARQFCQAVSTYATTADTLTKLQQKLGGATAVAEICCKRMRSFLRRGGQTCKSADFNHSDRIPSSVCGPSSRWAGCPTDPGASSRD